ncbi:hypothetical protein ACFOY8_13650 [Thalassospira xianhensis]|uniref:Uncharacterized protein n=1 Tax=Thalassospira xianhensis MCCC 1A02616 TaxID=1177929 RepID=A0A367UIC2_9PROT|nr:hypothetical protein [Thalassospira xianhensis]RCK07771.1 hypothetical protein TH5_01630 [Thalassospira xianhensis MCCC 1A02616]
MSNFGKPGEWIHATVNDLTFDEAIKTIYHAIIERTVGEAANQALFPYEWVLAPDGVGRPEKIQLIGHWLRVEARINRHSLAEPEMLKLLTSASLDDLWKHAQARLEATGFSDTLPIAPGDESEVIEFVDGFKLVWLNCPEAVQNEYANSNMPGVVGEGFGTLVLRDPDNASVAMLVLKGTEIVDMWGSKQMRVPFHTTETYLLDVIKEEGFTLARPSVLHGAVQTDDGTIYDVRDVPDGSTIDGAWDLSFEGELISRLPSDLTINGGMWVRNCVYLTETPRNLKVKDGMIFSSCPGLRKIGAGMQVGGWANFESCHQLRCIEENVDFGEALILSSEIAKIEASPFNAGELVIRGSGVAVGVTGNKVPRDSEGRMTIDGAFIQRAIKRQRREELAQIPVLAARVAYDQAKKSMSNAIGPLRKAVSTRMAKPEKDNEAPPSPKM